MPGFCIFFLLQNITHWTHFTSQLFLSVFLWLMLVWVSHISTSQKTLLLWSCTWRVILTWHMSMIEIITDPWRCFPLVVITGQWSQWAWSPHVSAGHQRHWPLWATGEVSNSDYSHYTQTSWSDSQVLWPLSTLTELTAHHKLVPIHQARPRPLQAATGSLHTRRCSNGHKKPARADSPEFYP